MTELHTIAFVGRSGCGKGTQAKMLRDFLKKEYPDTPIFYQETGESFRNFVKANGYTQDLAKEVLDRGGLQPVFLAILLWSKSFVDNIKGNENLIIDGSPRYLKEAEVLDTALDFYGRRIKVINLEISEEEAIKRLMKRGRSDDKDEKDIRERMSWYESAVVPVINHYRKNPDHDLIDVEGEQSMEEVHNEILEKLLLK